MKARALAIGNDSIAEEAAQDFLLAGGSAVGAVLTGYFSACGGYAGVLLGPLSILVTGVGVGARAFDGRLCQPGRGAKRPRGFQDGEPIPDAARVAIPTSVAAALVAHAYDGSQKLGAIVKPGIGRAQRGGADSRAEVLRRIRAAGASALAEPFFVRPMLHVGGLSEGGMVTPSDFAAILQLDAPAIVHRVDGGSIVEPPWAATAAAAKGIGCVLCAVDARGVFAALSYRRTTDGIAVDELELEAPDAAVPVERGIERVAPGSRLETPAPIAIRCDESGVPVEVAAAPGALRLEVEDFESAPFRIRRNPSTQQVEEVRR